MTARRFHSKSHAASFTDGEARRIWLTTLAKAREICAAAVAGRPVDRLDALGFGGMVRTAPDFPLRAPSSQTAAAAFALLARSMVDAGQPAAIAGFVAAGAECLEKLLTADAHAQAAISRRMAGEVDD